jgi:hypothetical protein
MYDKKYLIDLADDGLEGYELLELINHMANYSHAYLTPEQRSLVDEIESVLNYIYVRDQLEDGDEDGTHTDD